MKQIGNCFGTGVCVCYKPPESPYYGQGESSPGHCDYHKESIKNIKDCKFSGGENREKASKEKEK